MLSKTEAIVLKSIKYSDTSKIVTFYAREFGKIKGIAKGARSAKNKFGSALEPMTHSMLVLYKKDLRELHFISQCDAIDSFKKLAEDLDRLTVALAVIELVNQVTHDEERNPPLFALLLETLSALNAGVKNYSSYLFAFRLRLALLFGYAPNVEDCGGCGKPLVIGEGVKQFAFQVARGSIFCQNCCTPMDSSLHHSDQNAAFILLSSQALQIIRRLLNAQLQSVGNLEYDAQIGNQIDELLRLYFRYHFEGIKPLKSTELFHQQYKASKL